MLHEPRNGYMEKDVTSLLPNFFTDDWRDDWGGDRSWNPLEPRSFSGLPPPIQPPKEWNERAERTPSPLRRMDWAESFVGTSGRGRMEVPDVGIIGQAVGADRRAGQGKLMRGREFSCILSSRRTALLATAALPVLRWCSRRSSKASRREVFIWPLLMCGPPARAEVTLADVSKGIMGGDRDVYYPSWFLGEWEATTELVSVEFPQGEQMADKDALRQKQLLGTKQAVEQYPQKYIDYDGKIIADRGYNMRNYVRGSGGGPRALESVEWDPQSPNLFKKKDSEILVIQRLDQSAAAAAISHCEHRLKKTDSATGSPGAVGASLLRSIQNHQAHQMMTSAKDMSAAPYRPGELLSKAMTQETSDAQIPTNSAASFDMKGHKAAAEAHCEVSPDERDDDDDDDDDDYSDSEDAYEDGQRPVPPGKVDGQQLNVGSTGHHLRLCKPCAFWNTKGCKDGKECKFCHLCEPGEKKRRKKEKSAYIRNISRWRQTDPPTPVPPTRAPGPPGPPGPPIGGPGPSLAPRRG
eukprot:s541_g7.t2